MGILAEPLQFIRELPLPKGFTVAELGDQWITCETPHRLAWDFYRTLGSKRYCSIDGNGRATVIHDLNKPWKGTERYDLVTDFGTGEHIFSQWQVWRTLHVLCKVGGFIVFDRPASGYPEHGYYNVNRCLFDDLAAANQYDVLRLEHAETVRGTLWRGVWRKATERDFITPQQGRYRKILRPITE
jgi:hypothetical protein